MIPIQLTDILARLDHISELWRSDTAAEQRTDLADLDAPQHPHRQRREGPRPLNLRVVQQRSRPSGSMNSAAVSRS